MWQDWPLVGPWWSPTREDQEASKSYKDMEEETEKDWVDVSDDYAMTTGDFET